MCRPAGAVSSELLAKVTGGSVYWGSAGEHSPPLPANIGTVGITTWESHQQTAVWVKVSWGGGYKTQFINFSVSKIFDFAKVPFTFFESRSYLTGFTKAELQQHLSNVNAIFNSQHVFWRCWKSRKIMEQRKLALLPEPMLTKIYVAIWCH